MTCERFESGRRDYRDGRGAPLHAPERAGWESARLAKCARDAADALQRLLRADAGPGAKLTPDRRLEARRMASDLIEIAREQEERAE